MEITAAIEALRTIEPGSAVILRSDSEYLVKTMTLGWKRKANLDLWQRARSRRSRAREVKFEWVRGHAGNEFNERADRLATTAASGRPKAEPPLKAPRAASPRASQEAAEAGELARDQGLAARRRIAATMRRMQPLVRDRVA